MASSPQRPWLSDLLVCPDDSGALTYERGSLRCVNGHRYEVVGGIPRFTPPTSYADSFGFEWTTFPKVQLDDEVNVESEKAFREKTGLVPADVEGRLVLDGGCGMGRFSHVVAGWGARVVGVDISRAVEVAADNLEDFPEAALAQADLRRPPFASASFDVVFSIGVLHHTPNTFQAFSRIARLVKRGGILAVWVYSTRLRRTLAGGELLRPIVRQLPPRTLLRGIRAVVPRAYALKRRGPGLARFVDLVVPTSNHPDPEWRVLDTFDWYSPRYQWKHTYEEVEGWFRRLGFVDVERLGFPVSVRGRRPADG